MRCVRRVCSSKMQEGFGGSGRERDEAGDFIAVSKPQYSHDERVP